VKLPTVRDHHRRRIDSYRCALVSLQNYTVRGLSAPTHYNIMPGEDRQLKCFGKGMEFGDHTGTTPDLSVHTWHEETVRVPYTASTGPLSSLSYRFLIVQARIHDPSEDATGAHVTTLWSQLRGKPQYERPRFRGYQQFCEQSND